jgi:hypothetical protein
VSMAVNVLLLLLVQLLQVQLRVSCMWQAA